MLESRELGSLVGKPQTLVLITCTATCLSLEPVLQRNSEDILHRHDMYLMYVGGYIFEHQ